ncbi:MAG: ATP-binding cassette domain-containing protein [Saprospiraceae bacterium]|nr:ATP-binding cassette domain-containing protein [Saprospiraceae bacterium]
MIDFRLEKRLNFAEGGQQLDVEIQLEKGQFVTLYGKSGAGKTSILRMLAGLLRPDAGHIGVQGQQWYDYQKNIFLSPQKRQLGFLFQDYALFPNMSVRENLLFALPKDQPDAIIAELIELMELRELQNRRPNRLSGGQQQRVALARALVQKPPLLLLDEPLSALDQEMRLKLQEYLLEIHQKYGLTTILVSHEPNEILRLSDTVYVIEQGQLVNTCTPQELFSDTVSQSFSCIGKIISLFEEEGQVKLKLLVQEQIILHRVAKAKARGWAVGQEVEVELDFSSIRVKKSK